jgi:hypothetical protein
MLISMMAVVVEYTRKRKQCALVENFCYAPIDEGDRMRNEYLNNKI